MSGPADRELISGKSPEVSVGAAVRSAPQIPAREWLYQALNRHNLALLGMISGFLTGVDTFQSFYLQRVVNQFNEANLLPLKFYSHGLVGYLLYTPIDFLTLFGTLTVLWIWASYLLWYRKRFLSSRLN